MGFVKINKTNLTSTADKIVKEISNAEKNLNSIVSWCSTHTKSVPNWYDLIQDYSNKNPNAMTWEQEAYANAKIDKVNSYNKKLEAISSLASSYQGKFETASTNFSTKVEKIINAVDKFEATELDAIEESAVTAAEAYGDYGEMTGYDAEDKGFNDDGDPNKDPSGCGGGTPSSDNGVSQDADDFDTSGLVDGSELEDLGLSDDEDTTDDDGTVGGTDQTDNGTAEDGEGGTGDGNVGGTDQTDNGTAEDGEGGTGDGNVGGTENTDHGTAEDGEGGTGDGTVGGTGQTDNGTAEDGNSDKTAADIVGTSGNMIGQLLGDNGGVEMEDVASWGAAGAGALMLGLANLGADENGSNSYLSNLAMGLDESRTLPNAGIDVFEHPDYTQQSDPANLSNSGGWTSYQDAVAAGCTDVMSEEEFLNALASGDPRVSGYSNYQEYLDAMYSQYNNGVGDGQIDPFNLQSANELDSEGANGTSFAAGFGALAGAAAVGGLAAGAVMGFNGDEANGGGVNGSMNSQFGLNGSNGLDDEDGSKSLFDIIFGTIDENDEEERKKQSLRERIALIAMAATSTSGLATFLLANFGTISPVWFTIALLLFGLALFYFNLVKDKKNKRREELDAMKKMTRQGFFNRTNPQNTPAPAVKEVDWVLFGMVLLSTSAFILKTYDVISWLLFLILLILFLLIIFAYVIIKKKMGEEENGVPYQK